MARRNQDEDAERSEEVTEEAVEEVVNDNSVRAGNDDYEGLRQTWLRENRAGRVEHSGREYMAVVDNDTVYFIPIGAAGGGFARYDQRSTPNPR